MIEFTDGFIDNIQKLDSKKAVGFLLGLIHKYNDKVVAVYADVGSRFGVAGRLDSNELEIGISEQSLIPILGGMAHEGLIPFGIAYAPFITMRAADQIRMTIGEMAMNIKLIGGSAGLVSGNLGSASLALDDLAMMRAIPNIVIMSPSDCMMEAKIMEMATDIDKPVYIRLTGEKTTPIYLNDFKLEYGKGIKVYGNGEDAVVYSTGVITSNVIKAAKKLKKYSYDITVIDMPFVKPVDFEILDKYAGFPIAFTVEEHNVIGGLGSAVSEYIAEKYSQNVVRIGIKDSYLYPDTYDNLLEIAKLDEEGIFNIIKNKLGERKVI